MSLRISRSHDGVHVRLAAGEARLLASLVSDVEATLQPDALDHADPVYERLFPAGYLDDTEASAGFRDLTEASLRTERLERAQLCAADLRDTPVRRRHVELVLDADASRRWTQVLNDSRLAIGTRLGITDDDGGRLDLRDPQLRTRATYLWLTALQDAMVQELLG